MSRVAAFGIGLIVAGIFLGGCGIQMPVSEGLVFSSSRPYGKSHEEILPFIRYGMAMSTSSLAGFTELRSAAVAYHGNSASGDLNREYMYSVGLPGFGFSFREGRRVALGITPGLPFAGFHADATVRTVGRIFATINHNISQNGTELILQHPVIEKGGGGLSLGAFYRTQRMQFVRNAERWSGGEAPFRIRWYGVRLMGQTPSLPGPGMHVRGFANIGYVEDYKTPLAALGIAFTFD